MRDLMMLALMAPLLVLALRNAFAAYVLWGWSSTFGPQAYMYGFMQGISYVQWFALICLLLLVMRKDPQMKPYRPDDALSLWLIAFAVHTLIVATLAYPGLHRNWEIATNLLKILLFSLLVPVLVTSRQRVIVLLAAVTFGLATHGLIEGLKFVSSGGGHISQGNDRLGDRNHYALFIVMGLPLLVFLLSQMRSKLARLTIGAVIAVNVLAVVSTQSRGGLVSLMGVGLWLILRSQRKLLSLTLAAAGALLVVSQASDRWYDRMSTINEASEDGSFMGRVEAWKRASAIAVEHPFTGGGFHSVQAASIFEKYRDRQGFLGFVDTAIPEGARAAHSIYFEVVGDMGFVGLLMFLVIMFSSFVMVGRVKRLVKARGGGDQWAVDLAAMINVSMVAYLIGGGAVSMAYVDLPYVLVALAAVLPRLLANSSASLAPIPAGRPGPRGLAGT